MVDLPRKLKDSDGNPFPKEWNKTHDVLKVIRDDDNFDASNIIYDANEIGRTRRFPKGKGEKVVPFILTFHGSKYHKIASAHRITYVANDPNDDRDIGSAPDAGGASGLRVSVVGDEEAVYFNFGRGFYPLSFTVLCIKRNDRWYVISHGIIGTRGTIGPNSPNRASETTSLEQNSFDNVPYGISSDIRGTVFVPYATAVSGIYLGFVLNDINPILDPSTYWDVRTGQFQDTASIWESDTPGVIGDGSPESLELFGERKYLNQKGEYLVHPGLDQYGTIQTYTRFVGMWDDGVALQDFDDLSLERKNSYKFRLIGVECATNPNRF